MKHTARLALTLALVIFLCEQTVSQTTSDQRKPGDLKFEPYTLQAGDQKVEGELGRLVVKENRSNPQSRLIELAFVRLKSTAAQPVQSHPLAQEESQ